jgi:CRISPR-associated endoribonuclease Cas6
MRIRMRIATSAPAIPWAEVLRPGIGLAYEWMGVGDPALGDRLHSECYGPHGFAPFGHGAPWFPGAAKVRGSYAAGGEGILEFGSPVPEVIEAWTKGLAVHGVLDWGGTALRVRGLELVEPPPFSSGSARFRTVTPVVMKGSGFDEAGVRVTRQAHLVPTDVEFPAYLAGSLRRKAETFGLGDDVALESIGWVGPKRSFAVKSGLRVGAAVEVTVTGAPEILRALWSSGIGQGTASGFGWIAA